MTATLEAGRPAVIRDAKLGAPFVAEAAILEPSGWLRAIGRVRRAQAGELPAILGPTCERAWSPRAELRVEWRAGR